MPYTTEAIKNRFSRASNTYDQVATIQKNSAHFLVAKLLQATQSQPQTILDLGAGTGALAEILFTLFPQTHFSLNDLSPQMLEQCREKLKIPPQLVTYLPSDMQKLDGTLYDWVVSNFALQWVENLPFMLQHAVTKSRKLFAFSLLTEGTFFEWQQLLSHHHTNSSLNYYAKNKLIQLCEEIACQQKGVVFQFWTKKKKLTFSSPSHFMQYLKKLGASLPAQPIALRQLRALYKEQSSFSTHYNLFYGLFLRKSNEHFC